MTTDKTEIDSALEKAEEALVKWEKRLNDILVKIQVDVLNIRGYVLLPDYRGCP